jgi:hypothetical protein
MSRLFFLLREGRTSLNGGPVVKCNITSVLVVDYVRLPHQYLHNFHKFVLK